MAKYPSKYPKGLYGFNHYLMLVSLAVFLLWTMFCVVLLPFMKTISMDFLDWILDMCGWVYPITLAVFAVSSGVFVNGFAEHRMEIVPESETIQNEKTVKEFPKETKLYYKRWGIVSLVCFVLFFLLFLVLFFVDEKLTTVISCMVVVCFFLCGAGLIIFIKGWDKGVFFSNKK